MKLPAHQPPMPTDARRQALAAYRRSFRRLNPGWDVVLKDEGAHDITPPLAGKVIRSFAAPKDSSSLRGGIDVAATPMRATNHDCVDRARQDRPPLANRQRQVVLSD